MFLVGPYLFSGDDLDAYLASRRAAALKAAAGIPPVEVNARGRDAVIRDLYARHAVPVTNLHVESAHFTSERKLTADEREAIGVSDEDADKLKAITIAIPYSGDEHLFTCTPTIYSAHQPQADVRDGNLSVTYLLNEVEEFQLENNFRRLVALVERTLEVTQWQAMAYNERLSEALAGAVAAPADAGS
jgi:hypothetical protein